MILDGWLTDALRCPQCLAGLKIEVGELVAGRVITGTLVCLGCGPRYAIREGMMFFGLKRSATALRQQEIDGEFQWNFVMHGYEDHHKFAQQSFCIAQDAIYQMKQQLRSGRVLDAGAGRGSHAWQLCREGYEVVAADLSTEMLATADSYYSGGVYFERMVVDCTVLPLAESIFDAVFCKELAHHVEDLPELFIEFHRVLKADGTLVLIEPTAPRRPGMRSMPDVGREAGLTHQDYSVKDYLSALRIAGFHVSRLRHHRRLINKKYPILRCMDVLSTRALGLNRWNGLNFAKRLRAWLLGGEVVLLARRNELTLPYAGYRSVVELSAERLDAAHAEIAAMRSQETAFLPLLEQIQIEKGLDNWIPEV